MKQSYALPARQKQVFDFIVRYIKKNKQSPTLLEISEGVGMKKQNAHKVVNVLQSKGFVSKDQFNHRSIVIL